MDNNYLNRLPDDLQDVIYYKLHQLNMKNIKNELDDELNRRWNEMSIDTQDYYIEGCYDITYASYCIYDDNEKLIRPSKVAFEGY